MEVIIGMAGTLLAVILFSLGIVFGVVVERRRGQGSGGEQKACGLTAEEKRKREALIREQDAFRDILRYTPETAYQMSASGSGGGERI